MGEKLSNATAVCVIDDDRATSTGGADFERFVCDQQTLLVRFLRTRTASTQDAEDAAQESLMRMLRYRDTQPVAAWKPLLFRVAINVVRDQARRARTHQRTQHVPLDACAIASNERTPEQHLQHEQRMARMQHAIKNLPPKCRQVYLLKRMHGWSRARIAEHCGISIKMVDKHVAKAMATLRRKVGDLTHDAS